MKSKLSVSCFLLLLVAASAVAQEATLPSGLRTAVDKAVEQGIAKSGVPGASIAIVKDGKLAYVRAYGLAKVESKTPATPQMRYSIGSISKQFTAAAIMMLAEEGKLSLDDKVARFFPQVTRANEVTIRHLLTMTSGYSDYWPQDYLMPEMKKPVTAQQILDKWAQKALDFDPGAEYQYSNTNYVIAGLIVEKVSGMPFFTFLQQRMFAPLGLRSVLDTDVAPLPGSDPTGYERFALGPPRPAPKEGVGWMFAAGGLAMTASDLARWNISFMDRTLLKPASYTQMQTTMLLNNGAPAGYGLGLAVAIKDGRFTLSHSGEVMGFVANNVVFPEEQAAIVVLTNQMTSGAGDITDRIVALLFPALDPAARSSEGKVRAAFRGLQKGKIDRSQFTDNANDYFSERVLKDFADSLGPLGEPGDMNPGARRMRGGFVIQSYRPIVGGRKIRISVFETTDGKFEQFKIEPTE
jgi:D-alanyl-D-alanine carboxypeptidase